jgi:hypothetical protein
MKLLLPMDGTDIDNSKLTKINDATNWAQVTIKDGKLQDIKFANSKDDFEDFSEGVVVVDDGEYVWPFIELSMLVLVAHTQRYIEDIIEAYLFKELHDLAY